MSLRDSFFTADVIFPFPDAEKHQNFELAFGLTAFDNNQEPIDDPRYGKLQAIYTKWGF